MISLCEYFNSKMSFYNFFLITIQNQIIKVGINQPTYLQLYLLFKIYLFALKPENNFPVYNWLEIIPLN